MPAFTPGTVYTPFVAGYGSLISYASTTFASGVYTVSGSYAKLAYSQDITSPEIEVGDVKVTNNDSPSNSEELAPGMIKPGETSFDLIYTPAQQLILHTMTGDGNVYAFKEIYPDGSYMTWFGWVKKLGIETKTENEAIKSKVSIQSKSKPVYAVS